MLHALHKIFTRSLQYAAARTSKNDLHLNQEAHERPILSANFLQGLHLLL